MYVDSKKKQSVLRSNDGPCLKQILPHYMKKKREKLLRTSFGIIHPSWGF